MLQGSKCNAFLGPRKRKETLAAPGFCPSPTRKRGRWRMVSNGCGCWEKTQRILSQVEWEPFAALKKIIWQLRTKGPDSSKLSLHFSSVSTCMHVHREFSSSWRPDSHAFRTKLPCHAGKSHSWQQGTPLCSTMQSMNRFDVALWFGGLAPVQDTNLKAELDAIFLPLLSPEGARSWKLHWTLLQAKNMQIHTLRSSSSCCFKDFFRAVTFGIQHNVLDIQWFATKIMSSVSACQLPSIDKQHWQGEKTSTNSRYLSMSMPTRHTQASPVCL